MRLPAWDKTFEVDLKGYYWTTRELVRHLADRDAPGAISSLAGQVLVVDGGTTIA